MARTVFLCTLPVLLFLLFCFPDGSTGQDGAHDQGSPALGPERVVFQTSLGDIEFGFFPAVAPATAAHIARLARLGCYNTNHFFRVDKGFVAQVAAVVGGRTAPLNGEQEAAAGRTVKGEFSAVRHTRGILSMGRYDDPDSATSSFSILLGDASHLDNKYTVFGKMTKGESVLAAMEALPTKREGMFVMPLERVTILSTYVREAPGGGGGGGGGGGDPGGSTTVYAARLAMLKRRLDQTDALLQETRRRCLP